MPPPTPKYSAGFRAFLVLFTIFGIPILIMLPFLLSGFLGNKP